MKRILIVASAILLMFASANMNAQNRIGKNGYPIYEDYSVPVPDKNLNITRDDLKLTDKYLNLYPDGIAYADKEGLRRLYRFYRDDPQGQKEWKALQDKALKCIPTWDVSKCLTSRKRYMYAFLEMKSFAELYIFTGNELVSDFIRCHLAKAADLPIDFWMHAELRKLDPAKPKGYLESSHISRMLGTVITAVRRNMSKEEIEKIESAWHERAFVPMLNWLEEPSMGNFTAVISTGVLYAAKYFNDKEAWKRGVEGVRYYVTHTIEKDGSDSEGYGYYAYPAGLLLEAALVMDQDEIKQVFSGCDIDKTATWRMYGQMFDEDAHGMTMRISYGDNNYRGIDRGGADIPNAVSKYIFKDGIAEWIWENYDYKMNKSIMLLDAKFPGLKVTPVSPAKADLPLIRAFDSGDCFIRSDWNPGGMVLGLKSGDCGGRINNSHNRPEINSLTLGAYGEYFIVTCGAASYRSTIYKKHDKSTEAANTITIDGQNQYYPGVAKVTRCEKLPDGTYFLRSDIVNAYKVKTVDGCFRSVQFIPEGGFYIVRDYLGTADGLEHKYDYRFHIYNRDDMTAVSGQADFLKVERPKADLYIAMNRQMELTQGKGYMHGPNARDYDPDGPNQGKLGSATDLDWSVTGPSIDVCTVLYPTKKSAAAPKIKFGKDYVVVNGKKYSFLDETPKAVDASQRELFISFEDASKFVFEGGTKAIGPRLSGEQNKGKTYDEACSGEFWSKEAGKDKFKFEAATACNWSGYLCAPSKTQVKLPKIDGYRLSAVDITSIKNSGNKQYTVTGSEDFTLNKAEASTASHTFKINDNSSSDYYISCMNGELAIRFNLIYSPLK